MSRHQRLQRTLASPVRRRKQKKNRETRQLRRALNAAFDKAIRPHFPAGFDFRTLRIAEPGPVQQFRAVQKAARREKREQLRKAA
jgi:hypothetical protein